MGFKKKGNLESLVWMCKEVRKEFIILNEYSCLICVCLCFLGPTSAKLYRVSLDTEPLTLRSVTWHRCVEIRNVNKQTGSSHFKPYDMKLFRDQSQC